MPVRNYICNDCGVSFSLIVKNNDKRMKSKCKKCGSKNIVEAKRQTHLRRICPNFI